MTREVKLTQQSLVLRSPHILGTPPAHPVFSDQQYDKQTAWVRSGSQPRLQALPLSKRKFQAAFRTESPSQLVAKVSFTSEFQGPFNKKQRLQNIIWPFIICHIKLKLQWQELQAFEQDNSPAHDFQQQLWQRAGLCHRQRQQ